MTEMKSNEPIDTEFTEKETGPIPPFHKEPEKKHKKGFGHKFGVIALSAVISLGCGVGGGYAAYRISNQSNPTFQTSGEKSPSKVTNVSSNTDGKGLSTADVASKASPSVVEIVTESTQTSYGIFGGTFTSQAAGSGVIISDNGYIVTNNHVIEGAQSIQVTTFDGTQYDAHLVGTDPKSDIAVLKINADNLTAATIGDSSQLQAGDTAVVIGNPLGTLGGTVTDGIISSPSREMVINNESMELIQTNAQINSGNSGGGLFDGNGNLIGVVNAKDSGTTSSGATIEGLGFAIPVNTAMDVAQQLIQNGEVTNRPTIGVYLQELTQPSGHYHAGLYITGVMTGSGAEKAGIQEYDRIVKADGKDIASYADLSAVLRNKKIGDSISMTIERDGKQLDVTVPLTGTLDAKSPVENNAE